MLVFIDVDLVCKIFRYLFLKKLLLLGLSVGLVSEAP